MEGGPFPEGVEIAGQDSLDMRRVSRLDGPGPGQELVLVYMAALWRQGVEELSVGLRHFVLRSLFDGPESLVGR